PYVPYITVQYLAFYVGRPDTFALDVELDVPVLRRPVDRDSHTGVFLPLYHAYDHVLVAYRRHVPAVHLHDLVAPAYARFHRGGSLHRLYDRQEAVIIHIDGDANANVAAPGLLEEGFHVLPVKVHRVRVAQRFSKAVYRPFEHFVCVDLHVE